MSKLPESHRFVDLSDYGRPLARVIAAQLKESKFTPIHVTWGFLLSGLIAVFCILNEFYIFASFFLLLKSVLDAADGELARVSNTPSYVGRYFDSIADIILNFLILIAVYTISKSSLFSAFAAFIGIQLQGTLYNYYYVILRNKLDGDTTSRIFEHKEPRAFEGEQQKNVKILFHIYKALYSGFDKLIFKLDRNATTGAAFPNWFMTLISTMGFGFQLLLISVFLVLGFKEFIIPLFIVYTTLIFVFVGIIKVLLP